MGYFGWVFTIFAVMKLRNLFIGLVFLLVVLTACDATTREARRIVKRAYLLADTLPDSTVRLIDSVLRMPASFSERERMDMALLQAEALFGERGDAISPVMDDDFFDDHANISTSPELERAAAYYARKKQYGKAAHAALYSGFVQQHYNEKETAMRSFKEAEQYGLLAADSHTVAQAEYWMGKMLFYEDKEQEALRLLKSSENSIGSSTADLAIIKNSIAMVFVVLHQYDSADFCLQQSLQFVNKGSPSKLKQKIQNNYAVLCRQQGKFDKSIQLLRQVISDENNDDSDLFVFFLNMGKTLIAANKVDSASFYFQQIEAYLPVVRVKQETLLSAYGALSYFAEITNNDSLALKYREKHEDLLYELMNQRQEQSTYRIQRQYDYEALQNTLNRKIIQKHRIISIISSLLLIASLVILYFQYRHKQLLKAEKEMRSQIDDLKKELRKSVKSSYLEQELSSRIRLIVSTYHIQKQSSKSDNEWNSIAFHLMNGKNSLYEAVLKEIEKVYPEIQSIIQQKYPELNETETKVCILSFSNLTNKEISKILNLSLNTVNKNRSKVRCKLNLKSEKMKDQLQKIISN